MSLRGGGFVALSLSSVLWTSTPAVAGTTRTPLDRPACVSGAPKMVAGGTPTLRIAWTDLNGLLPFLAPQIAREVQDALAATGTPLVWRDAFLPEGSRDGEISVVLVRRPSSPALPPTAMGAVSRRSSRAWIFLSGVEHLLRIGPAAQTTLWPAQRRDLARALGRVVAHEIVHVMAPRLPHTPDGLMRAQWSRSLALAPRLPLGGAVVSAFVAGIEAAACAPPRSVPDRAAVEPEDDLELF